MYAVALYGIISAYLHELMYALRPGRSEQKEPFLSLPILSGSMIKKNFFFFPVWSSNHSPWGSSWGSGGGENNLYIWILRKSRHHKGILQLIFHSVLFWFFFIPYSFLCAIVYFLSCRRNISLNTEYPGFHCL